MIKTLVLFGSPRPQGFTKKLLDEVLSHLSSKITEINAYQALQQGLNPCTACGFCQNVRQCSISDEMQAIYSHIDESDIIIFASPVYFYGVPAPLKMIIDRLQPYWEQGRRDPHPLTKKGAILLTGGARSFPSQFTPTEIALKQALKDIGAHYVGGIFLSGTDYLSDTLPLAIISQSMELAQKLSQSERI